MPPTQAPVGSGFARPRRPGASVGLLEREWDKYGPAGLLQSSADRGWSGLSAELRNHGKGVFAWTAPPSDIEICVDVCGNGSLVTRRAAGIEDRKIASRGTIWLSPPGLQEGSVEIAEEQSGILHIYLSVSQFSPSSLGSTLDQATISALSYESAFEDPLLAEIAYAIASELKVQTSAGNLLVDALAGSLAARLVQRHISASVAQPLMRREGLDRRRLFRVLDYIEANLESDLTIDRMASIACLSRHHFARSFKQAVGHSPHRYVSAKRLERAKALLIQSDRSLVDIALSLSFSCQANFTRAFRQVTGQTPGHYRQTLGPR
ncbi:helix-turn-helix domain-containing protein [Bradyrhizobium genosp. A]|uniref:helix-turn-helix domain-containing protein n=1 Tax=Bradyrhizobium genosp. A TaxID=83626 RepID=UPI003CEF5A7D